MFIPNFDRACFRPSGIGTLWVDQGIAGPDNQNCPYRGTNANREYRTISGCSTAVPTELDFGEGTACGHWDEDCMGNELMTGFANGPISALSRITIGTLQDLGYKVDYSRADAFGRANLGTGRGCTCRRRERSIMEMLHGETIQIGLSNPDTKRRRLSDEMKQVAIDYGLEIFARRAAAETNVVADKKSKNKLVEYEKAQAVSVFVRDGDGIYGVVVRNQNQQ
jgi:hypothetical protein